MLNALGQPGPANSVRSVTDELLEHPAVRGLSRSSSWFTRQSLAYLPSREFATALVDVVCPPAATSPRDMSQVLSGLQRLTGNPTLQSYLIGLAQESEGDLDKFRERLAHWFDATQEQVSALYRSYSGFALMFIALAAALLFNIDSLRIGQELWWNPQLRANLEKAAGEYVKQPAESGQSGSNPDPADALARFSQARGRLMSQGLPLGWSRNNFVFPAPPEVGTAPRIRSNAILLKMGGLLLTAFAVSLGAPFWFDLLNRLINIRAAVGGKPKTEAELRAAS